jgi:hypothetical protein
MINIELELDGRSLVGFEIRIAPRLAVTRHRNPYLTSRDLVGENPSATLLEKEVRGDALLGGLEG